MTLPAVSQPIPTPTPQHAASLSPQQLADHRQAIASEVEIVLSAYFQPNESASIRAGQLAWWCDELQDWTREQVVFGLREWNRENPRRRPTPGDVLALLKAIRGRKEAARLKASRQAQPEPERERIDADAANEILARAGFAPKRAG